MHSFRTWGAGLLLTTVCLLGACGDDLVRPAPTPAALHLRPLGTDAPFAINIGGTLPLEALPIAADSEIVGTAVAAHWTSSDSLKLTIRALGVVQARCVGTVVVTAEATVADHVVRGKLPIAIGSVDAACAP